jgi:hypothetical protein
MGAKDLSILIPARSEMFLAKTIENILENIEADTEVIAVLDGAWADPPIPQNERVNVIYVPEAIGQRSATNLAARLSRAKYVMKVDAHCSFDKGFDRKMIEGFKVTGDNVTAVPVMRNLWAYDWKCMKCGKKWYQGPTPTECKEQDFRGTGKPCDSKRFKRKMMWIGKERPQSWSYCFDAEPHFQYNEPFKHTIEGKIGAIIGYKLLIDFSSLTPDLLAQSGTPSVGGTDPSAMTGIINLLANFAGSHQFTVLPNPSGLWQNVTSNTVGFAPINNGWGVGAQEISFIRDKAEMERVATLPVLTDVVNYGYILSSSSGDGSNNPSIGETMCQGFLSELSTPTVTPTINSSSPNPTTRRTINSDTLDKFNRILGGEFVYSEIRKCFHNGSVALIPIHSKDTTETMSLQGSCYMMTREQYSVFAKDREDLGSWGSEGLEIACKTWLSGGRVLVNHNTWYAHMFRTQGGDFSFPYPQKGVQGTKKRVKDLFWDGKFEKQIHPVSWLIRRFFPIKGWDEKSLKELEDYESKL